MNEPETVGGSVTVALPLGKTSWPDPEEVRLTFPHDFTFKDVERVVDHQKRTHVVYFIFCAGFVKIGTTSNLKRRLAELQIGAPWQTRIVGLIPGGRATELFLHFFFRDDSAGGEWFIMSDQLRKIVSEMAVPPLSGALEEEERDYAKWICGEAKRLGLLPHPVHGGRAA